MVNLWLSCYLSLPVLPIRPNTPLLHQQLFYLSRVPWSVLRSCKHLLLWWLAKLVHTQELHTRLCLQSPSSHGYLLHLRVLLVQNLSLLHSHVYPKERCLLSHLCERWKGNIRGAKTLIPVLHLSTRLPNSGRIILAQISSASAIPLAAILLLVLPDDPSTTAFHGLILVLLGLFVSWNAPATNNPIFAEIVPEKSRTSVYALDKSFESILSSFAPPIVGILAQHVYGYKPIPEGSSRSAEIATDRENASSLAKALYTSIGIPMAACCFIYSFLYRTYPLDRDRARMEAFIDSEMRELLPESSNRDIEFSQEDPFVDQVKTNLQDSR